MGDGEAIAATVSLDATDDTARLVFADWLQENDQEKAAHRLRWWVAARQKMREAVVWDKPPANWSKTENAIKRIKGEWCRRLYAVEIARIVREKWPLDPKWAGVAKVADETLAVAERFALLLATEEELFAASSAASSAARSAARSAAWSAADAPE